MDYTDLVLRFVDGDDSALLLFNANKRALRIAAVEEPVAQVLTTSAQLKDALTKPGTYTVQAGTYTGNFVASAADSVFKCADGVELLPSDVSRPTLTVTGSRFTWQGATIHGGPQESVVIGSVTATTVDVQPDGVLFDGTTVTAPMTGAHRGMALHARNVTLNRCTVVGYYLRGQEAQAVWINNGPGPYTLQDCYLEGAGENFMSGGSTVAIPNCVPSDILIRGCTFAKREAWRSDLTITVKNLFELKSADRVIIENCLFDNVWPQAQIGTAIVFTPRGNSPWCKVDNVIFRHNILRHVRSPDAFGISILGSDDTPSRPTAQIQRMLIENNLFEDCGKAIILNRGVGTDLTIRNNTFCKIAGAVILFANYSTVPKTPLTFTQNVTGTGAYLFIADGAGAGQTALDKACAPSTTACTNNVIERAPVGVIHPFTMPLNNTVLPAGGLVAAGFSGPQFFWTGPPPAGWDGIWPAAL